MLDYVAANMMFELAQAILWMTFAIPLLKLVISFNQHIWSRILSKETWRNFSFQHMDELLMSGWKAFQAFTCILDDRRKWLNPSPIDRH
jgi:lipopolysaccharide biosynthesis glycosyltransferase